MTDPDWTLLFRRVDAILAGQDEIRAELAELRKAVAENRDESVVLTGLVLRHAGEHIAWGGVQEQLRKIQARLDKLEGRPS